VTPSPRPDSVAGAEELVCAAFAMIRSIASGVTPPESLPCTATAGPGGQSREIPLGHIHDLERFEVDAIERSTGHPEFPLVGR
jgi:nicotinamide mononucleotide (NMN) deamidase PncC